MKNKVFRRILVIELFANMKFFRAYELLNETKKDQF